MVLAFADRNDILIKNILGNLEDIKIFDGDIRLPDNGIVKFKL